MTQDGVEAARWYKKAAGQGHIAAQYYMGRCSAHGRGVAKSDVEAVKWFRQAADQGDAHYEATKTCQNR